MLTLIGRRSATTGRVEGQPALRRLRGRRDDRARRARGCSCAGGAARRAAGDRRAGRRCAALTLEALALGLLHGPAELLPVSSSGHVAARAVAAAAGRSPAGTARGARSSRSRCTPAPRAALAARSLRPLRGCGRALLAAARAAAGGRGLRARAADRGAARHAGDAGRGLLAGAAALALADRSPRDAPASATPDSRDGLALGCAQAAALVPGRLAQRRDARRGAGARLRPRGRLAALVRRSRCRCSPARRR